MTKEVVPFGALLYDELRRRSGFSYLAARLDYAAIQELKVADRAGTARLFHCADPDLVALIESKSPGEVAEALLLAADEIRQASEQYFVAFFVMQLIFALLG